MKRGKLIIGMIMIIMGASAIAEGIDEKDGLVTAGTLKIEGMGCMAWPKRKINANSVHGNTPAVAVSVPGECQNNGTREEVALIIMLKNGEASFSDGNFKSVKTLVVTGDELTVIGLRRGNAEVRRYVLKQKGDQLVVVQSTALTDKAGPTKQNLLAQ